jgi:hypothetical protein
MFLKLRRVKILDISGTKSEIDFIKFILLYSRRSKLTLYLLKHYTSELITELIRSRRVSCLVKLKLFTMQKTLRNFFILLKSSCVLWWFLWWLWLRLKFLITWQIMKGCHCIFLILIVLLYVIIPFHFGPYMPKSIHFLSTLL